MRALVDAISRANQGQIDADLGGGVIKQRIARVGSGKSSGYRSVILFRKGDRAFFVFGYAKSDLANIREDEQSQFKKMAKYVLALTEDQLTQLVDNGQFEKVNEDD